MSALPAPLPPGAVYGDPYIRVRVLGQGSFGRVLLVRDSREETGSGSPAAHYVMKEIDLHQFGAKGRVEALKEVAFLNQLSHPYIIRYKEFFERTVPLNGPGAPQQQPGQQLVPLGKDGRPVEEPAAGRKMLYIVMESVVRSTES
jgi:serine/threonine protein kinase